MLVVPAIHGSFKIERTFDAQPARVFAMFADKDKKASWFVGPPGWRQIERRLDFRVGGEEKVHGRFPDGTESIFHARYHEIVPNQRIVYVYDMAHGRPMSVSLATIELEAVGAGTRLTFVEHAVYIDGADGNAMRKQGTEMMLGQIAHAL